MIKRLLTSSNRPKGFTLIELVIAIAIMAVIGTVLASTVTQLFVVQAADKNRMEAVKQVENALHYINRDIQMSSPVLSAYTSTESGFPLRIIWTDYTDDPTNHTVIYTITGSNVLERSESIPGRPAIITRIADNIDPAASNYSFDGVVLTVNLTSSVSGLKSASETRTLEVQPRPTQ